MQPKMHLVYLLFSGRRTDKALRMKTFLFLYVFFSHGKYVCLYIIIIYWLCLLLDACLINFFNAILRSCNNEFAKT